jgi:hypothetical protein
MYELKLVPFNAMTFFSRSPGLSQTQRQGQRRFFSSEEHRARSIEEEQATAKTVLIEV